MKQIVYFEAIFDGQKVTHYVRDNNGFWYYYNYYAFYGMGWRGFRLTYVEYSDGSCTDDRDEISDYICSIDQIPA